VIEAIGRYRPLPEQFWLSARLIAWGAWSESGIWQYYEAISREDFEAIASGLHRVGLHELGAQYSSGMDSWQSKQDCDELDQWIDKHQTEIKRAAFQLIAKDRHYLYDES
jgi:hypothetical protein